MSHPLRKTILILVPLLLIGGAAVWYRMQRNAPPTSAYRTSAVTRGELLVSIDATGTVEPEEVIDVGAQVAGKIISFGTDRQGKIIDYGSQVEQGMMLARIDDSLYVAEANQADAQLQAAQASLQRAEASREQLRAKLDQAARNWTRAQKLGPSEALAQASYDEYRSSFESAKANLAVGEAEILQARASVAQAKASQSRAQRNLGYCTITAPVRGVVIDRRVNIGQTVVSSMSAPSLFLLAKDLTRMQVWVAVNEADIGKIQPGQKVRFDVDAFPDEHFVGEVGKIRLNAAMTQNVVTYTVEIVTNNKDGRLLPYLTANVQFELAHRRDAWLVPNAALRWTPASEQILPSAANEIETAARQAGAARAKAETTGAAGPQAPTGGRSQAEADGGRGTLWVVDGPYVKPLPVRTGLTNGLLTAIESPAISEGLQVVTGVEVAPAKVKTAGRERSENVSPFTPQMPRRPGGGAGPPR